MNGPFKMKGFSGFGNSPLNSKPGGSVGEALSHWEKFQKTRASIPAATPTGTPRYKGPSVARTYMAKQKLKTGVAKTHMVKQKFPKSRISTLTKAARFAGRMIPGIGLASLFYKTPKTKDTFKKIAKEGIKKIKKK